MPENIFQREHIRLHRAHPGALCEYLVQMLSTASPVMLFINCNARATGCDSVVRINFIDVNKLRRRLIQTLRLSMTAILGQVHILFLNGLWLPHSFLSPAPPPLF